MWKFGILFVCRLYNHIGYAGIWQLLISHIYNHIVYAEIWWFVGRPLIQPYCIRGNFGNYLWAAYTTTLYTWEFGDLFVCRLYNHIVYTGIWWFVSRLLIQPYCIHGNLAIWLYAAYTTTVYMRVFGVQFVSPRIQLHCISGLFRILKVVMFFIPKAHMFFDMVESDL